MKWGKLFFGDIFKSFAWYKNFEILKIKRLENFTKLNLFT